MALPRLKYLIDHEEFYLRKDFKSTEAIPGTPEKIEEMRYRSSAGLPVFHRDDRGTRDFPWWWED